ncbi:hypothetical protein RO13_12075 [Escherichia coli]|nr:hypothetical protein RO13_12075 [Escherichia coli]
MLLTDLLHGNTQKEDCNDRPNYEIQALFTAPPVPVTSEELVKAVHFYEQLKRENPPASGNLITDSQIRQ